MRSFGAILAGVVIWTILWLSSSAALSAAFPQHLEAGKALTHTPMLVGILILSVVFSVIAGYLTALVARQRLVMHTLGLGIVQLALGIYFQTQSWDLIPLWYHISFLGLLIPGNVLGGVLRARKVRAS